MNVSRGLGVAVLLALILPAIAFSQATPDVTLTGTLQGPNGLPLANQVLTFTPTQTFFVAGSGGGAICNSYQLEVNAAALTCGDIVNFNNLLPAPPPLNGLNVIFQTSKIGTLDLVSAYLPLNGNSSQCLSGNGTFVACGGGGGGGGTLTGSGTPNALAMWTGTTALGNSPITWNGSNQLTSTSQLQINPGPANTYALNLSSTFQTANCTGTGSVFTMADNCRSLIVNNFVPLDAVGSTAAAEVSANTASAVITGTPAIAGLKGNVYFQSRGTTPWTVGVVGMAGMETSGGTSTNFGGVYGQAALGDNPGNGGTATTGFGVAGQITNNAASQTQPFGAALIAYSPILTAPVSHVYGLYVQDQTPGGANNPDPWAIFTNGTAKSQFGGAVTILGTLTTNLTGGPFCLHETAGVVSATTTDCGSGGGGGGGSFNAVTTGTNTGQTLLVGSGSTFGPTGTGTITATMLPHSTVSALPSAATAGANALYEVTDGSTGGDCTVGGGTSLTLCRSNGTIWSAIGDGGAPSNGTNTIQISSGTGTFTSPTTGTYNLGTDTFTVANLVANTLKLTAPFLNQSTLPASTPTCPNGFTAGQTCWGLLPNGQLAGANNGAATFAPYAQTSPTSGQYLPSQSQACTDSNGFIITNCPGLTGAVALVSAAAQHVTQQASAGVSTALDINNLANFRYVTPSWNWSYTDVGGALGNLTVAGANTVTLSCSTAVPCPLGIDVNSSSHFYLYKVYISTAPQEAALVTGGTCTPGATTGTCVLNITTVNNHANGYVIGSSSTGIQEAWNDAWVNDNAGTPNASSQTGPNVKLEANTLYKIFASVYLRGRGGILDGAGALIQGNTRDRDIYVGTTQANPEVSYHKIYNMTGTTTVTQDGVQVASVCAGTGCSPAQASGTYLVTTAATHPFTTSDTVVCEYHSQNAEQHWMSPVLSVPSGTTFTISFGASNFAVSASTFGWCNIEHAFLENNSEHVILKDFNLTQSNNSGLGSFNYGVINDNDQQFIIDGAANRVTSIIKDNTANWPIGAFFYQRADQGNAGIMYVHNTEIGGQNCADSGGNGFVMTDSVCQGFPLFGIRYAGALQPATIENVYEESTGSTPNPLYTSPEAAQSGIIVQGAQGTKVLGTFPISGFAPVFATGGSTPERDYFVVPHCSSLGVGPLLFIGSALPTSGAVSINVQWPSIELQNQGGQSCGTLTWDVLEQTGSATSAPSGTGSFSIATGISGSCNTGGICSFTDTQSGTSSYTVANPTATNLLFWFWPADYVVNGVGSPMYADAIQDAPFAVSSVGVKAVSIVAGQCRAEGVANRFSPIWIHCPGSETGSGAARDATLFQQCDTANNCANGTKGRLNLGQAVNPNTDLITLQDSNFPKTVSLPGGRPTAAAADMALGIDQANGLAERASVSISEYINALPSGTNYLERLTATGKTFNVPVTVNGSTAIAGPDPHIDVTNATYGADPTGAADSAAAINNAIAACPSGGGRIFFPPGTYKIASASIALNVAGCELYGYNQTATIKKAGNFDLVSVTANNTAVRGLIIDGQFESVGAFTGHDIIVKGVSNVKIDGNLVQNPGDTNGAIYLESNGGTLQNVWVTNNTVISSSTGTGDKADGIFAENNTTGSGGITDVWITDNKLDCSGETLNTSAAHCIAVHGTQDSQDVARFFIERNDMIAPSNSSGNHGFCLEIGSFVVDDNAPQPHHFSVKGNKCTLSSSGIGGISIAPCNHCSIEGNQIKSNGFVGQNTGLEMVFSHHTSVIGNQIGDCEATASNGFPDGMSLDTLNYDTISGNTICGIISANGDSGIHLVQAHTSAGTPTSIVGTGNSYLVTFGSAYPNAGEYQQGSWIQIASCSVTTAFNGIWQVKTNPSTTSLTFLHPTTGLATDTTCHINASASFNVIANNVITFPFTTTVTTFGIEAQNSTVGAMQGNIITNNTITGNGTSTGETGIAVTDSGAGDSDQNKVTENQISQVSTGILLGANVTNTIIAKNNTVVVSGGTVLNAQAGTVQATDEPTVFANLASCSAPPFAPPGTGTLEGNTAALTDSTTNTWGATITGSGTDHVQGYCDGSNWTVVGK